MSSTAKFLLFMAFILLTLSITMFLFQQDTKEKLEKLHTQRLKSAQEKCQEIKALDKVNATQECKE